MVRWARLDCTGRVTTSYIETVFLIYPTLTVDLKGLDLKPIVSTAGLRA